MPHLIKQSYSKYKIVRYIDIWGYTAINKKTNQNKNDLI